MGLESEDLDFILTFHIFVGPFFEAFKLKL